MVKQIQQGKWPDEWKANLARVVSEAFFGETTCKLTTEWQIEFGHIKISGKVLQVVGVECSKARRGEAVWPVDDTEER